MIRRIKFSNFYSFNKEQEISFLAKKKDTFDYYNSKNGDQITKIAGFIGSNASGKTNVMRLFSFLGYFVCRKIEDNSSQIPDIAYKTFFNNKNPASLSLEFEFDSYIYFYEFLLKNSSILKESLSSKKIEKGAKKTLVFRREKNSVKYLNSSCFINKKAESLPSIRLDVSFIAFIKRSEYNVEIINHVYNYFEKFKTNINEVGQLNPYAHQVKTLGLYIKDKNLKNDVEKFVQNFDLGLSGFRINKEKQEDGILISVDGLHETKAKNKKIDFSYESRGTQSLFFAMANILTALKENSVVIIDEIEAGFHPEALSKLIGYFIDEDQDKMAQLLFTSHSYSFMNRLDLHQIYLVDKNESGESAVKRLNKVNGIRSDNNHQSKYMSGSYGSFPDIKI